MKDFFLPPMSDKHVAMLFVGIIGGGILLGVSTLMSSAGVGFLVRFPVMTFIAYLTTVIFAHLALQEDSNE